MHHPPAGKIGRPNDVRKEVSWKLLNYTIAQCILTLYGCGLAAIGQGIVHQAIGAVVTLSSHGIPSLNVIRAFIVKANVEVLIGPLQELALGDFLFL